MSLVRFLAADEARLTDGVKWSAFGPDVLAAWVAVMDVEVAAPIREAIIESGQRSVTGYPNAGLHGTSDIVARWHRERHGSTVDPTLVRFAPHVTNAIGQAFAVFTSPGDRVILSTPVYHPFFEVSDLAGLQQVRVSMLASDDRYHMDLERIDHEAAAGGVLLICQPHNPTGSIATRQELEALADISRRHGNPVISDEIHAPLRMPGAGFDAFSTVAPDLADRTITVASATKSFNLPGLRLGWLAAGTPDLAARIDALPFLMRTGYSSIGPPATRAALTEGGPWLDELRAHLADHRRLLADLVARHLPAARWLQPAATYLAWLDLSAYALEDPAAEFLEAGVALSPGAQFGEEGRHFVRLNFGCHPETLIRILERMGTVVG